MKIELTSGTGLKITTNDGRDLLQDLMDNEIYVHGLQVVVDPGETHCVRLELVCFSAEIVIPDEIVKIRRMKYESAINGAEEKIE